MMPRFLSVAVGVFGLAAVPLGAVAAERSSETKSRGEATAPAASELVQAALECELHGQSDRRASLLQEAVAKAPDAAPAHWHSGEVALDGKWLSVAQVQNQMRSDAKLAEYRRLREQAAGIDKGDDPTKWWNWWVQDYNAYEMPGSAEATPNSPDDDTNRGGKKKYEITYDFRSFGSRVSAPGSCFARGTQVPTLTGLMAIEDIKVGDRVLAEDADTGELAFKPVLAVTTRAPGPRIKIGIGEQVLVATPGHPFWVVGQGWRMAKQLTTGMWLHGPAGTLEITSLENVEAPQPYHEVAYNLIVADFNTYFVGAAPVLVHDNTPRKPASTPVPGLARPIALASSP